MSRPVVIKIASALLHVLAGALATLVALWRQDWFGAGDAYAALFWTVPLAAGLAASGGALTGGTGQRARRGWRLLLVLVMAALFSFGWFCVVTLFLGPMMGAFSIPVFYLWLVGSSLQLAFLSWRLPPTDMTAGRRARQLLWFPGAAVAALAGLLALSLLSSYLTRPAKEMYLIPAGFEGPLRVVYGEPGGLNPPLENGRRVMRVPTSGILIVRPEFRAGAIDNEYYEVERDGARRKLRELPDQPGERRRAPGVRLEGSGGFGGAMPDGGFSSESPLAIAYTDFRVVGRDTTTLDEATASRQRQQFDSLMLALVADCRRAASR